MHMAARLAYLRNLPEVGSSVSRYADDEGAILQQISELKTRLRRVRELGHDAARTQWTKGEIAAAKALDIT